MQRKHFSKFYLFLGIVVLITVAVCVYANLPLKIQSNEYQFFCPRKISVQTQESQGHTEVIFRRAGQEVGRVNYYPNVLWDDIEKVINDRNADVMEFLESSGVFQEGNSPEGYMMESGSVNPKVEFWEKRNGVERTHYFYFTEDGHCFDLWFYNNSVSAAIVHNVKESFKLEVIT